MAGGIAVMVSVVVAGVVSAVVVVGLVVMSAVPIGSAHFGQFGHCFPFVAPFSPLYLFPSPL
jgi:hypothetical protein